MAAPATMERMLLPDKAVLDKLRHLHAKTKWHWMRLAELGCQVCWSSGRADLLSAAAEN